MNKPTENSGPDDTAPSASDKHDAERAERVRALRSMLEATEVRQNKMKRVRRQVLAAGLSVRVRKGINSGVTGTILDADYITNRVLIELTDGAPQIWVNFTDVEPISEGDEDASNPLHSR